MQLDNTEEAEEGKRGGRYESCPFWRTLEKYAAERVKGGAGPAALWNVVTIQCSARHLETML
jgi:hypothetical protein